MCVVSYIHGPFTSAFPHQAEGFLMRARLSTVLPMLCVLCAPALANAQQRASVAFEAPRQAFAIDQEQEQEQKPDDAMSTSGFFLGIIGMLGGAAAGSQIGQSQCPPRSEDKECMGRHAYT